MGNGTNNNFSLPALQTCEHILDVLQRKLDIRNETLKDCILRKDLYFRVSVNSQCNLSCRFCHNEGAVGKYFLDLDFAQKTFKTAYDVGFRRVQFTGGEPLLRDDIGDFIAVGRKYFSDVGITTNGTFLPDKLTTLIQKGITRIHVSLQEKTLEESSKDGKWKLPEWLTPLYSYSSKGVFKLFLNLPIPAQCLDKAEILLPEILQTNCNARVFSILPEGKSRLEPDSYEDLKDVVDRINLLSEKNEWDGKVLIRGYGQPSGIRCLECQNRDLCKEQSHSLRLGADKIFRPCLATRAWDIPCTENISLYKTMYEAALLATDFDS